MCGILCMITNQTSPKLTENNVNFEEALTETKNRLNRRGPNLYDEYQLEISTEYKLKFIGNVLWQQGTAPCKQPIISECKCHILLFNGDIYSKRSSDQSDTEWLINEFIQCKTETEFLDLFRKKTIYGPFSMIYFNDITKTLYFMRDSLGRQSLLLGKVNNDILLTSVASKYWNSNDFIELPAIGIFKLNIYPQNNIKIELIPWQNMNNHIIYGEQLQMVELFLDISINVNNDKKIIQFEHNETEIFNPLWTFDNIEWLKEYQQKPTTYSLNNIEINEIFQKLLNQSDLMATCDEILNLLSNSVRDRCLATPNMCKDCLPINFVTCNHPKIGILYSGGVDCSILAILANRFIDLNCTIDLINVSFEKVSKQLTNNNGELINYDTPDRLSARQTLIELKNICPKRKWNLVEVNVTRKELNLILQSDLSHLVYPLSTVLDESLGAALWFAARSNGIINETVLEYKSPCRVLLMGSGADELFGGYTRHRNAFRRPAPNETNWESLQKELQFDWVRLPGRNLARDDRVIGDLGCTVRSPFVEEFLSIFIRNLLAEQKCFHYLPEGVGDKLLLRLCAYQLGLRDAAWLRKRALQFGSRIANSKQNAKDRSMVL